MTFWQFLDKRCSRIKWPSERQWVTVGLFVLTGSMLKMAEVNPKLWDVKLFEIILQAIILTGIVNMVLAFHFSANKADESKVENTAKAFEAITATANAGTTATDNMNVDAKNVNVDQK